MREIACPRENRVVVLGFECIDEVLVALSDGPGKEPAAMASDLSVEMLGRRLVTWEGSSCVLPSIGVVSIGIQIGVDVMPPIAIPEVLHLGPVVGRFGDRALKLLDIRCEDRRDFGGEPANRLLDDDLMRGEPRRFVRGGYAREKAERETGHSIEHPKAPCASWRDSPSGRALF